MPWCFCPSKKESNIFLLFSLKETLQIEQFALQSLINHEHWWVSIEFRVNLMLTENYTPYRLTISVHTEFIHFLWIFLLRVKFFVHKLFSLHFLAEFLKLTSKTGHQFFITKNKIKWNKIKIRIHIILMYLSVPRIDRKMITNFMVNVEIFEEISNVHW